MSKFDRYEILFLLLILILFIILKLPVVKLPLHWDGIYFFSSAVLMSQNPFIPMTPHFDFGHPPLFFEILAWVFYLFRPSILLGRTVLFIFSLLTLFYTYLLGKSMSGKKVGYFSILLLFFSPLFIAQSGIMNLSIPLAAFGIMTVYYTVKRNILKYILCGSCLLLVKGTGVIIIVSVLLYILIKDWRKKYLFRRLTIFSFPLLPFLIWQIYHYIEKGWMFYFKTVPPYNVSDFLIKFIHNINISLFYNNYIWIVLFIIVFSILLNKKKWIKKKWILFVTPLVLNLICCTHFSFSIGFLPRYNLYLYPLFFIMGSVAIRTLCRKQFKKELTVIVVVLILFLTQWYGHRNMQFNKGAGAFLESNLEYIDVVKTHKKAAKYIELNYPNAVVLSTSPMLSELKYPWLEYVNTPIRTRYFKYKDIKKSNVDLIYFSPQSHNHRGLLKTMRKLELILLKRFEKNGKYAEVYKIIK